MADDSDGRSLLDDEGRIFGLVNVIDVLVVLLVIAVVAAGAALLLGGSSGEPDSRYATVDLGSQPGFVAEQIEAGDAFEPEGTGDSLTITDVYRYDGVEGTNVVVRGRLNGTTMEPDDPADDPVFQFRGQPVRIGQGMTIRTQDYEVSGELTQLQRSGETLPTENASFLVRTTVSESTADEVAAGDEYRVAGETVAEITGVQQFPADARNRSLLLSVSARALDRGGSLHVGSTPLRVGNGISFSGTGYQLSGEILRRGTNGVDATDRPFLIETTVDATVADDISVGDQYRLGGSSLVSVETKTLYATDEPEARRAILGVSVLTREVDGSVLFGDRELRVGQSLPVETGEYEISGEIIRRGTLEQAGEPTTRTASIAVENVRPAIADALVVGQTERVNGETTAEILTKESAPAEIILESEDGNIFLREHPRNLDVDLEAELSVRELDDGSLRFRGDSLRTGDTITLELGQIRVSGRVTAIGE